MSLQDIECSIKSCIISKKEDTTLQDLRKEYCELVGQEIPFTNYGYKCLEDFINKLPGLHLRRNSQGHFIVSAASEKAGHIANLVSRQKNALSKAPKKRRVVHSPKTFGPSKRPSTSNKQTVTRQNNKPPLKKSVQKNGILSNFRSNLTSQKPDTSRTPLVDYGGETYSDRGGHLAGEAFRGVCGSSSSRVYTDNREEHDERGVRYTPNVGPRRLAISNSSSSSENLTSVVCEVLHRSSSKSKAKYLCPPLVSSRGYEQKSLYSSSSDLAYRRKDYFSEADSSEDCLHSEVNNWRDGHYRMVRCTKNSIQCVVTSYSNSPAKELDMSNPCNRWDNGPVMMDFHLVGDDFLLHFGYECLVVDCEVEDEGAISCGMCISGQTISDFHFQLCHEGAIESRIVLMLGSVDILQGRSLPQIINDMMDLLNEIKSLVDCVVLLTLPFLINGGIANQTVLHFNEFLKELDDGRLVRVIDVHSLFKARRGYVNERCIEEYINYKCYERFATSTANYPEGITLWSHLGRSMVYNLLIQKLPAITRAFLIER